MFRDFIKSKSEKSFAYFQPKHLVNALEGKSHSEIRSKLSIAKSSEFYNTTKKLKEAKNFREMLTRERKYETLTLAAQKPKLFKPNTTCAPVLLQHRV